MERPKYLSTSKALGEDVYQDAYFRIKESLKKENKKIDMIVLLMANAGTINSSLIKQGILMLKKNKRLDSAVSTSVYNMWSPVRARRINKNGFLEPFVPFNKYPKKLKLVAIETLKEMFFMPICQFLLFVLNV